MVVELCQYRVSMLKMDERTLLREAKEISLEKLQQAVRQVRVPAPWGVWSGTLHPGPRDSEERRLRPQPQGRSWSGTLRALGVCWQVTRGGGGASACHVAQSCDPTAPRSGALDTGPKSTHTDRCPKGDVGRGAGGLAWRGEGERGHPWGRGQAAGPRLRVLRWACSGKVV